MDLKSEILKKAESYRDYTAENLSTLVKIQSYSGKEENVCKKIVELCQNAGFDEVKIDGLGSVIARIGSGNRVIAFDAHIDTVEEGDLDQWNFPPLSGDIKDGLVYGRGSSDQKGGAASMITAGRILKDLVFDRDYSIYFTFTVMEEDCDGLCWKYLIEQEGLKPSYIISTEPTSCSLYRGHRGRMEIEVKLKGVSSHGSAPERGVSAAYKAARAVLAIEQLNRDLQPDDDNFLGKGTVVVSKVDVKGPSQCAVPDQATIYLDRRLTWREDDRLAISQVKEYITNAIGENDFEISMPQYNKKGYRGTNYGQELYFPTWKIPSDHSLVRAGVKTYQSLFEKDPIVDKWTFSTNLVATTGRHNIPAIGFGPGDEDQAHAPNEINRIEDLVICSAFYSLLPYILDEGEL